MVTLLLVTYPLLAQQKTITGTVIASTGEPLEGVTVSNSKTNKSTATNLAGTFTIQAATGETLVFTSVGYSSSKVVVGSSNNIRVALNAGGGSQLAEVVVTAMDIRRNPRELGYSVQTVKGSDIQQTQRENFVNSLQGRVAGLTVTPTSGAAGASSAIVLRGFNTLSGSNQPLFIVDGIIIDNQTLNSNSQSGSGIGLASDGSNRNNDNTNRIADINPNDIESVTVLKGPEATALYGSQASSGAIVITTKKSKGTAGKVLLAYDNNFRFQKITRYADVNNDYGPGGSNNIPTAPPTLGQIQSFGPLWKPGTTVFDNLHHFFRTGFSHTHNISAEFGTKDVGFRASGSYFDNTGVVPYNSYTKYNFKISNNTKIGKYISISPSIAYTNADNLRPLKSTATSSGAGGYLVDLYAWPGNNDVRNFEDPLGQKLLLFNLTNRNADYDNPIWSAKNNNSRDKLNRWIGTLGVDINPFSWLSLAGRFGYDTYKNNGYVFNHPNSFMLTSATAGSLDNYYRTYNGYNHTITATAKKNIGDFSTRLLVGTMWQDYATKQFAIYGTNLIDSVGKDGNMYKSGSIASTFNPDDSSITTLNTRRRLLRNNSGLPNENIFRELAYFGEVSVGYKNYLFLTYSHRFETASPIPAQNRNYNYPGASLSMIVSDMFPAIKKGNILNFAKLRGSLANTARLNDPYSNQSFFVNNFSSTILPVTYTYGFTNANPYLTPENQQTYEIGTELRFLNDAISLEAAYYNTLCTNQIAQGYRASYATGFILNTQNAASLRNEGLELTLNVNPIKKNNFNWNISFNFNHMWSKVLTLPESIGILNDYYNSDTYISNVRGGLIRGHSTGTITGSTYQRNNAGQILINPSTGIPLTNTGNQLIADRTPAYTLGTLNSFRYKNWTLSFLWDLKVGGDIYNGTDQILTGLGKSQRTANRSTALVVNGVLNDGLQNTATPTLNTLAVVPQYLSSYYTTLPDEEFIQKDVNWFRLRDLTLNYTLPANAIKRLKAFSSLGVFVTGNDLVLLTNYYGADPAVNANNPGTNGVGGYGLDLGSAATPLSISFGLRARF
ncbi:SusC/RagA family TonB-linked outer membrane protein [Segetibacter aerophilus]|uniref:SusC/RagA family TonB-linked outer membrane protein n=2 Tax=Segetibacter aerophilus TaxID=670293 RepID=A0A512BIS7_9BACT|nr:SusC/RagA family TonB-linked outer membrane protein [Segetibacter aerophilus]